MTSLICGLLCLAFSDQTRCQREAARITDLTVATFYDPSAKIWRPRIASAESVGTQGYTFWPSLLAWQAFIEGAKVQPDKWLGWIDRDYEVLEKYFDPKVHAYCAWTYFPGNDDHFYDDNGWAAIACMEAYQVTGEKRYEARATEILRDFLKGGWDGSGNPGGVRWGTKPLTDRGDRTVSATAACALAALLVSRVNGSASDRHWAIRLLDWIRTRLSAPSGLIYDGFRNPGFERMPTVWTYNTGVTIRAAVELYRQTGQAGYLRWARKMGDAAIDRTLSPLYDGAVADLSKRHWYDGIYFVQYLVDGLRALSQATGDPRYLNEAARNATFCLDDLRDRDGLYWRNMRLWTIDTATEARFHSLTGQSTPALSPDPSERAMDQRSLELPVGQRPMVKTLLANASAARMFWLLAH